jgi:hypothetical protein
MKARCSKLVRFLSVLGLAIWTVGPRATAQTPAGLDLQLYAGLTVTGAVGTVYQIQYVTDLAQTNDASTWRSLEFLQLPASPYLWADKSTPATGRRFYRAVVFPAPKDMVFIPPGTFRMGSPPIEAVTTLAEAGSNRAAAKDGWSGNQICLQRTALLIRFIFRRAEWHRSVFPGAIQGNSRAR